MLRSSQPNTDPIIKRQGGAMAAAVLAGLMCLGVSSVQGAAADSTSPAAPVLAPQMIVKPVITGFQGACRTETLAQKLSAHAAAGETREYQLLLQGTECMLIPPDGMFRVLKVRNGMIEFVSFSSRSFTGYWTTMAAMKPAK